MDSNRNAKSNHGWTRHSRLDGVLNVLLIVLALGVLGMSAVEVQIDPAYAQAVAYSTPSA
jgi:hypothetical protein